MNHQTASHLQFPRERHPVDTNLGPAVLIGRVWFKWWLEMNRPAITGLKNTVVWWKEMGNDNATVHHVAAESLLNSPSTSNFPFERHPVETNIGMVVLINSAWYKWWP